MSLDDIQGLLQHGIEAAQNKNHIIARTSLRQVVEADPDNELGWMWLTQCVDTNEERKECLQQVLRINPNNAKAKSALNRILEKEAEKASREGTAPPTDSVNTLRQSTGQQPETPPAENVPSPLDINRRQDRPRELWASQRENNLDWTQLTIFGGVAGLAILLIVFAVLSLAEQFEEEVEETPTPPITEEVLVTPGETPTATLTVGPPPSIPPQATLPPPPPPTATETASPTPTFTPTLPALNNYQIIYSANDFPGNAHQIYTSLANGNESDIFNYTLPDSAFIFSSSEGEAEGTPELDEDTVTDDPTAEPTEAPTESPTPLPTPVADAFVEFFDPAYSPDGSRIAFVGTVNDRQELYVVSTSDPSDLIALTDFNSQTEAGQIVSVESPSWSPDGNSLMFAADADGDFEIYRIAADGSTPPGTITSNDSDDRYPAWSPDGNYFAFASDRDSPGELELYVSPLRASTDNPVCSLTVGQGASFAPSWSPDGSQMAYISTRRGDTDLYIIRLDGFTANGYLATELDDDALDRDPAWSPDGLWVIWSSNRNKPSFDLWLINPETSEIREVTDTPGDERHPAWFPRSDVSFDLANYEFICPR